jgi:hypothetical protein
MHEIVRTERVAEGISLTVLTPDGEKRLVFGFPELIDRGINAFHLLEAPHKYLCDPETRSIARKRMKA